MDAPNDTFREVPNNLRHIFKYSLATQSYGYPGDEFITIEEPTAKLAGKTIALSFKLAKIGVRVKLNHKFI